MLVATPAFVNNVLEAFRETATRSVPQGRRPSSEVSLATARAWIATTMGFPYET